MQDLLFGCLQECSQAQEGSDKDFIQADSAERVHINKDMVMMNVNRGTGRRVSEA